MRHWKGWDAMNPLNQSKGTQSWCERWNSGQAIFNPNHDLKHVVVTILEPICQSQPSPTIHYTYEERLEGLRWCEMAESVCTRSMLVWNIGAWYRNFHHLRLKSRGVMTVVEDEFQSPPSPTIHYTYNDTLEGLGCCELAESVSTHTIWVRKVSMGRAKFVPSQSWKIGCGDLFQRPYTNLNHV